MFILKTAVYLAAQCNYICLQLLVTAKNLDAFVFQIFHITSILSKASLAPNSQEKKDFEPTFFSHTPGTRDLVVRLLGRHCGTAHVWQREVSPRHPATAGRASARRSASVWFDSR